MQPLHIIISFFFFISKEKCDNSLFNVICSHLNPLTHATLFSIANMLLHSFRLQAFIQVMPALAQGHAEGHILSSVITYHHVQNFIWSKGACNPDIR